MHALRMGPLPETVSPVREAPAREPSGRLLELLDEHAAARATRAMPPAECQAYAHAVHAARSHWTPSSRAAVPTLGRAWHLYLALDRGEEYFAHAASSDALVARVLPELQGRVLGLTSRMLDAPSFPRVGWCGPGVEVHRSQPARASASESLEGRTRAQIEARARAVAFALVLDAGEDAVLLVDESVRVPLRVGDVAAVDGDRTWRVDAGAGSRACLVARVNAVEVAGRWETWF